MMFGEKSSVRDEAIASTLADARVVGGAFDFRWDLRGVPFTKRMLLRFVGTYNRIRFRISKSYFGDQGIFVWSGNYYAVEVMDRLGVSDRGGLVRIGFVHYNTVEEVDRVLEALDGLR